MEHSPGVSVDHRITLCALQALGVIKVIEMINTKIL